MVAIPVLVGIERERVATSWMIAQAVRRFFKGGFMFLCERRA